MQPRNRLEAKFAADCASLGIAYNYEPVSFDYVVHRKYTPDFRFFDCNGQPFYIETKGFFRKENMETLKAFRIAHPNVRLIVAMQSPKAKVNKGRMTYAQWCQRYGFPWCPAPVPREFLQKWLDGFAYSYDYDDYLFNPKRKQLTFL